MDVRAYVVVIDAGTGAVRTVAEERAPCAVCGQYYDPRAANPLASRWTGDDNLVWVAPGYGRPFLVDLRAGGRTSVPRSDWSVNLAPTRRLFATRFAGDPNVVSILDFQGRTVGRAPLKVERSGGSATFLSANWSPDSRYLSSEYNAEVYDLQRRALLRLRNWSIYGVSWGTDSNTQAMRVGRNIIEIRRLDRRLIRRIRVATRIAAAGFRVMWMAPGAYCRSTHVRCRP
jgi:hypothetical protein